MRDQFLGEFRPARERRRHARRPLVKNFEKYVYDGAESETTNAVPHNTYRREKLAAGKPAPPHFTRVPVGASSWKKFSP